ncbi:MAG: hypothetical protein WDM77_15100 [Steroidobacteraceae bacterium]
MLGADIAQALQIAHGRQQHAGGAGDGLDDHGGNGRGILQGDDLFQFIGEFGAVLRQAAREGIARQVMGMGQVIDIRQQRA